MAGNQHMVSICEKFFRGPTPFTHGAHAAIYKGYTKTTRHQIAIKKYRKFQKQAKREIKILSKTEHINIIKLLDWDFDDGTFWMIFDYCNTGDLFAYCEKNMPNLEFTLNVVQQCAEGLNYLHTLPTPVIHGNIQTRNILLHGQEGALCVKLCGFGLSKLGDELSADDRLGSNEVETDLFKSPEMIDMVNCTASLDIFSLGLVLECLYHYGEEKSTVFLPAKAYPPNADRTIHFGKLLSRDKKSYSLVLHDINDSVSHSVTKLLIDHMIKYDRKERPRLEAVIGKLQTIIKLDDAYKPDDTMIDMSGKIRALNITTNVTSKFLQLLLRGVNGKTYHMIINEEASIQDLRKEVMGLTKLAYDDIMLTDGVHTLVDEDAYGEKKMVYDYPIHNESVIYLTVRQKRKTTTEDGKTLVRDISNPIVLRVVLDSGKKFFVHISKDASVVDLMQAIQDKEGTPTNQMRLIWQGKQLDKKSNLSDYGIWNNATIELHLLLIGD